MGFEENNYSFQYLNNNNKNTPPRTGCFYSIEYGVWQGKGDGYWSQVISPLSKPVSFSICFPVCITVQNFSCHRLGYIIYIRLITMWWRLSDTIISLCVIIITYFAIFRLHLFIIWHLKQTKFTSGINEVCCMFWLDVIL